MTANLRLTRLKALTNLAQKVFNAKVSEAYDGRINKSADNTETDKQIRDILLIDDSDTVPEVNLKISLFYLVGDKLTNAVEEYIASNKKYSKPADDRAYIRLYMKPNKSYIHGVKAKGKYIEIKNVLLEDEAMYSLSGFTYEVGNTLALYSMLDGSQIKLYCKSEKDAHDIINRLLKACKPDALQGTSEENTYFGKPSKNKGQLKMTGLQMTASTIAIYDKDGTPKGAKLLL